MARELAARRARRRVRPHRHLHAGVRHAGELARRRAERAHRQPRPRGRRDVHAGRRRTAQLVRRARPRPGRRTSGAGRAACAGCPRSFGELPVAALAEEIDTPGEGQVRALITVGRQPGRVHAQRGRLERAVEGLDFMLVDRHLPERDDAPRRRDPARRPSRWRSRTTTSRSTSSPRATWPTTRPPILEPRRTGRVGGAPAARRDRLRPGAGRGRRRARRHGDRDAGRSARSADPHSRVVGPRRRPRCSPSSSRGAGPERMLDLLLRTGPYGDAFGDRARAA